MDKTAKAIVWVVVIVLVIWGIVKLAGGGSNQTAQNDTGPIKVGIIAPLTGDAAVYGEPARNVMQLAVDEINAAGGIGGRTINLVVEDGKCNGKDGADAAQKLVNVDKVRVIIGGFCSSESMAAVPIAAAGSVALFSNGSSNPGLTSISPFFFRDYPSDSSQGAVLAQAAHDKGWKKVAMVQEQTDYAAGIYKAFNDKFVTLGGVTVKEDFPTQTSDFRSVLSKLKDSKSDVLFIDTQTPAVATRIMEQIQQLKWKPALIINDGISGDPATLSKNATLLEGALTAEFGVDPSNAKFQHLISAYKAKYGVEPPYQSYAQTEYDSVYIIKDAIAAVGYNGEKIAQWAHNLSNWQGASGSVTIGADGDRVGGHTLMILKNGKLEIFK